MGKQKARALFNPSILCFSTEGKNVAQQNLIPLTCTSLLYYIWIGLYLKIFRIFVSVGCKNRGAWTSRCRLCVFIPYYGLIELQNL